MMSCSHKVEPTKSMKRTYLKGNNFDIESTWEVFTCPICGDEEKGLYSSIKIPFQSLGHRQFMDESSEY